MDYLLSYSLVSLVIAAFLGIITGTIAKNKGYSFGLWWFYGWMLFIVAIIHVCSLPDKNAAQNPVAVPPGYSAQPTQPVQPVQPVQGYNTYPSQPTYNRPPVSPMGTAEEIKKYKELLDQGILTEEEFQKKKAQLLNL